MKDTKDETATWTAAKKNGKAEPKEYAKQITKKPNTRRLWMAEMAETVQHFLVGCKKVSQHRVRSTTRQCTEGDGGSTGDQQWRTSTRHKMVK